VRLIQWLWCAWALYWLLAALRNKATRRREPLGSRLAHVLPLAIGGALLAWPDRPRHAMAWRLWPLSSLAEGIGVALVIAGLAFAVWARVHLGRNWSGAVTVKQDHELVRTGPYAWVRHPIYTGLITALLGVTIASGTVHAALGLAIIVLSLLRKSRVEEAFMRATFPGEYPRYSEQVPALIPFAKRPRPAAD
jgi:protein-S-isoprenylcysteine O-methyltransferase Ste14